MKEAGRKVLVVSGVFPPTRVAESDHVLHLCRGLGKRGLDVEVLTRKGSINGADLPFRVRTTMEDWDWAEFPRLARTIREIAPDVVFLFFAGHLYNFHPMVTLLPTMVRRVAPRAKVVTQLTCTIGSGPYKLSLPTRATWKALISIPRAAKIDYSYGTLLRDSDQVIVMANSHLQEFARISPGVRDRSTLIPPPPLLPMTVEGAESRRRGRHALGLEDGDFVFAYFGRLRAFKGLETLLEAFKLLLARKPGVKLAIIGGADQDWIRGSWSPDDLHDLARTLGITESVVWSGEYSWDSDLGSAYLRAADVAVLPFDNGVDLNNSSFAAVAAHGLPTITTRGEAMEDVFIDDENVLLCSPRDPTALATAMERQLIDADLRQRLRVGIETLARDWFSWDINIDRTIDAFNGARLQA
jgi:glycosyltransferase involved in cell wall biosynthesis